MSNLRSTIEGLASQFAGSIIEALRGASIEELLNVTQGGGGGGAGAVRRARAAQSNGVSVSEPAAAAPRKRGKGGRLGRRSTDEITKMVDSIVDLLARSPEGLRAEQIRDSLGVEARELPRPLADALNAGRVKKTGQKRATTYFAASEGGRRGGGAARRPGRKKK